jgi:hypothetical protein
LHVRGEIVVRRRRGDEKVGVPLDGDRLASRRIQVQEPVVGRDAPRAGFAPHDGSVRRSPRAVADLPVQLRPHAHAVRRAANRDAEPSPAEIAETFAKRGTCVGSKWSPRVPSPSSPQSFLPQAQTVPSLFNATEW